MVKAHIPTIPTLPNRMGINFIASDVGDTVNFAEKLQSSQSIPFRILIFWGPTKYPTEIAWDSLAVFYAVASK